MSKSVISGIKAFADSENQKAEKLGFVQILQAKNDTSLQCSGAVCRILPVGFDILNLKHSNMMRHAA